MQNLQVLFQPDFQERQIKPSEVRFLNCGSSSTLILEKNKVDFGDAAYRSVAFTDGWLSWHCCDAVGGLSFVFLCLSEKKLFQLK